jgi:hypothetical protein
VQLSQLLPEHGKVRYYAFEREDRPLLEDHPGDFSVTWFSDEVNFHLDGYINK